MSKRFKQVSTGLTLVCNREDVIKQCVKPPSFQTLCPFLEKLVLGWLAAIVQRILRAAFAGWYGFARGYSNKSNQRSARRVL